MRALWLCAAMVACSPQAAPSAKRPPQHFERIDDAWLEGVVYAMAIKRSITWIHAAYERRGSAPPTERALYERLVAWAERADLRDSQTVAMDVLASFERLYPDDDCLRAIRMVDFASGEPSDESVNAFMQCFPSLPRSYLRSGVRCEHRPDEPSLRDAQLRSCIHHLERCVALDPTNHDCAALHKGFRDEFLSPYCTPMQMNATLRVETPMRHLDVLDFAYAYGNESYTVVALSPRGRRVTRQFVGLKLEFNGKWGRVRRDDVYLAVPIHEICQTTQRRETPEE
jgi:hypothetical protein